MALENMQFAMQNVAKIQIGLVANTEMLNRATLIAFFALSFLRQTNTAALREGLDKAHLISIQAILLMLCALTTKKRAFQCLQRRVSSPFPPTIKLTFLS